MNTNNIDSVVSKPGAHGLSFKDAKLTYVLEGLEAVKTLFLSKRVSVKVLEHAVVDLSAAGTGTDLADWLNSVAPQKAATVARGRGIPQHGQSRTYKIQMVENGAPFIRLPISGLGKGASVLATFNKDNTITISRV